VNTLALPADACAIARSFSADWATVHTAQFPMSIELAELKEPATMEFVWDARLFVPQAPVFVTIGDLTKEVKPTTMRDGKLQVDLPKGATNVAIRVSVPELYPNENLADIVGTTVSLATLDGAALGQITADVAGEQCAPWGAELTVDWICLDTNLVPAAIKVRSVGPNQIPVGTQLVAFYPDVIALPTVVYDGDGSPVSFTTATADGYLELTASIDQPLAADSVVKLAYEVDQSNSSPAPFGSLVPNVRLLSGGKSLEVRQTGSSYSIPATSSGTPLSTYLPAPSAG